MLKSMVLPPLLALVFALVLEVANVGWFVVAVLIVVVVFGWTAFEWYLSVYPW